MKNIKKLIVIEGILFLVAGIITVLVGKFTADSYGTILFFIGAVTMAIGVFSQLGPEWHRPMPRSYYSYEPKTSVSQQHLRDIKDLESKISLFLSLFIVGIIPVVIGLILMQL